MSTVKQPVFVVKYAGKNITEDITDSLISLTYTDAEENESDEITFTLADPLGLWRDAWYPKKGDKMELQIGYQGEALVPCGTFAIDELTLDGGRDNGRTITIKALAASITEQIRTKRSTAHEKRTLKQIAQKIASANGYTVEGEIPDVQFERITQYRKSDLEFLRELAQKYGCMFSVRDKKIIFTSIYKVESAKDALELDETDLITYRYTDKSVQTYKKAEAKYHNPKTGKVVSGTADAGGTTDAGTAIGGGKSGVTAEDALELRVKAENEQQARLQAQAALHRKNSREAEGFLSTYGEPRLLAGVNFVLTGMGVLSGRCHITKSTHRIDRGGGYVTEIDFFKLKDAEKPAQRKPKRRIRKQTQFKGSSGGGGGGGYGDRSLITQSD